MIKNAIILLSISTLFSMSVYAKEPEGEVDMQKLKPSILQKNFGVSKDLAMKYAAYQMEYGVPNNLSSIKPNQYLTPIDIERLKKSFMDICKKHPDVCKGVRVKGVIEKPDIHIDHLNNGGLKNKS